MTSSSRSKAKSWPYPRHAAFEKLLQKSNAVWFAERGCAVNSRMPYLLEHWEDWPRNIILPEVAEFIQSERALRTKMGAGFPLHKYIHHGLSSQAMLFNLIGPLAAAGSLEPLKTAFEFQAIPWPSGSPTAVFEVENRSSFNEDSGQPTSIDLVIQAAAGERSLFIESKLVEHEFGGCSVFQAGDCDGRNPSQNFEACYLHHIGRRYWTLMEKYGFLDGPTGSSPICPLTLYYQFFREVLFALESGGDFVLLYDERNPTFYAAGKTGVRGLMPFLQTFVPQNLKTHVHAISLQQVIHSYTQYENFTWLAEFEKKYALDE